MAVEKIGGQKGSKIETQQIKNEAVTEPKLARNIQEKLNEKGSASEATSSTQGILKLTEDFSGTANAPKVVNLHLSGPTNIGQRLTNLSTPTESKDATNKSYVEEQFSSIIGDEEYTTRSGAKIKIKADETTPSEPAEGAVLAEGVGVARKKTFRFRGNGAKTEFTLTHNFNSRQLVVQGQENNSGNPGSPVTLAWEPESANAVKIFFNTAPAGTIQYFVTILG